MVYRRLEQSRSSKFQHWLNSQRRPESPYADVLATDITIFERITCLHLRAIDAAFPFHLVTVEYKQLVSSLHQQPHSLHLKSLEDVVSV
jgi:hypothetical protein